MDKPHVKFCWWCGRKLLNNHHKEIIYEGHKRICHKGCAKAIEEGREDRYVKRDDELLMEEQSPC